MIVDGPHFQATDEGELVFLLTDGDDSRRPTEHDIIELDEESPLQDNYYLRIPLEHPGSHHWRNEIAKYLAPLVLGGKSRRRLCARFRKCTLTRDTIVTQLNQIESMTSARTRTTRPYSHDGPPALDACCLPTWL